MCIELRLGHYTFASTCHVSEWGALITIKHKHEYPPIVGPIHRLSSRKGFLGHVPGDPSTLAVSLLGPKGSNPGILSSKSGFICPPETVPKQSPGFMLTCTVEELNASIRHYARMPHRTMRALHSSR